MHQKTKKCILSVCDISPSRYGSFEEFLIFFTEKLSEKRFRHVIVFRETPVKVVEDALLEKGAEIKVFKPSKSSIYNFFYLYRVIKNIKPDIVHFHFYPIYSLLNYLKFSFKIIIVYTDHMGYRKANTLFKKVARRSYYYASSKLYDKGIDKIICVSNFVKDKYPEQYGINPKKMCVIYNGINVEKFKKDSDTTLIEEKYGVKGRPIVTIVGLRKDKGPHYLVKAAPSIIRDFPNVMFLFVGEGECKNYLEELVAEQKITEHVTFAGKLQNIIPIYQLSSCVVIPSEWEEAFCFVAAEAMSTETNIIAFNSGAIKEVVFNQSQLISKDHSSLSNSIKTVLKENNEVELRLMRKHVIEKFSLDTCVENYIYLYECLLV